MSDTPSDSDYDRNYINGWAVEGLMRAVDRVITRKHDLESDDRGHYEAERQLMELKQQEEADNIRRRKHSDEDDIKLRKYNEEWIKNNIR